MDYFAKGWTMGNYMRWDNKPDCQYLEGEFRRFVALSGASLKRIAENSYAKLKKKFPDMSVCLTNKTGFFTKYYEIKGESKNTKGKKFFCLRLYKKKIEVLIKGIPQEHVLNLLD